MPFPAVLDASVLNPLLALVLCAALLWVCSAVAWEATAPGALRTGSLDVVAVLLLAAGLWWPAHAGSAFQTTGNGITLGGEIDPAPAPPSPSAMRPTIWKAPVWRRSSPRICTSTGPMKA